MPSKIINEDLRKEIIDYYLSSPKTLKQVENHFKLKFIIIYKNMTIPS